MLALASRALRVLIEYERSKVWPSAATALGAQLHAALPRGDLKLLRTITDIHASREESSIRVFDGEAKARHRDRVAHAARHDLLPAAARAPDQGSPPVTSKRHTYRSDPLLGGVSERLLDRLEDCKARSFPRVAVIGGAALQVLDRLSGGRVGIEHVTVVDTSHDMLKLIQDLAIAPASTSPTTSTTISAPQPLWPAVSCEHMDPTQEMLPLEPGTFDLVVSCLGLHWTNDLPTLMAQCRFALKDDGLFLGALFAGDTLQELRISCALAQMERQGGVSPVVSPFAQVRDGGNLLTRAGLALPAVDMDEFVVRYGGGPTEVVDHLRALGEVNAVVQRQTSLRREAALAAGAVYQSMFGDEGDGSVPATFQVMFLTGWAPHESQQRPAKRGSATVSFKELADGLVNTGAATGGTTGEGGGVEEEEGACGAPGVPPTAGARQ